MQFGIYAGSATGDGNGLRDGKPDDSSEIQTALSTLQGDAPSFLVRAYIHYKGNGTSRAHTPVNPMQYAVNGRKLDLVLCYQTNNDDMDDWCAFIEHIIDEYSDTLGCLQLTEETNAVGHGMDGDYSPSKKALIRGVIAAKKLLRARNLETLVGFSVTPSLEASEYWQELASLITPEFLQALDYVGLDFFPDVFRPIPLDKLEDIVAFIIDGLRNRDLVTAGIDQKIPIHITENGWPNGIDRPLKTQAEVLERILRTIHKTRTKYNITAFEYFQLRDTATASKDTNYHFGILEDDYTPKPVFESYRKLITKLDG